MKDDFINLMNVDIVKAKGSYNYKGNWSFIDQIIVSKSLIKGDFILQTCDALIEDWLLYVNKYGDKKPNRTYGGNNWYGGFSDHLPIYCTFKINY